MRTLRPSLARPSQTERAASTDRPAATETNSSDEISSTPQIVQGLRTNDELSLFAKLTVGMAVVGSTLGGAVKGADELLRDPMKSALTTRIHQLQGRRELPSDTGDFVSALKALPTAEAKAADSTSTFQAFPDTARAPTSRAALDALPRFQAQDSATRAALGRVFQLVDSNGGNLYRVLAGRLELDTARSVHSRSTLQELITWADTITTMPAGAARNTHVEAMQSALQDVAIPGRIQQNTKGTCTVTSIQYYFARENPAEYLRVLRDLTGATVQPGSGPVRTMTGDTLQVGRGALDNDRSGRRLSEKLFQITGMETGNGDKVYLNGADGHVLERSAWIKAEVDVQRRWEAQTMNQLARETQSLDGSLTNYGPDHDITKHYEAKVQLLTDSLANIRTRMADTAAIGQRFAAIKNVPNGGGLSSLQAATVMNSLMNTGLTTMYVSSNLLDAALTVLERRADPLALVSLDWASAGHMLAFERTWVDTAGTRMIELRNPWGSMETGRGAPARTTTDGQGRIVMNGTEFMKYVSAISLRLDGPLPAPNSR